MKLDFESARQRLISYNTGFYRGHPNLDLDARGYKLFAGGLPDEPEALVEMIRFVGEDYGGAQKRFLNGQEFRQVSEDIARNFSASPGLARASQLIKSVDPIETIIPPESVVADLFRPFRTDKHWPVWASKFLHFLRPDTFPILDSRAESALDLRRRTPYDRYYVEFMSKFRETMRDNKDTLASLHSLEDFVSPHIVKVLDKILYVTVEQNQ